MSLTVDDLTLDTTQTIDIKAEIETVFRSVLQRLSEGFTNPQGESLQMILSNGRADGGSAIAAMVSATFGDMCK